MNAGDEKQPKECLRLPKTTHHLRNALIVANPMNCPGSSRLASRIVRSRRTEEVPSVPLRFGSRDVRAGIDHLALAVGGGAPSDACFARGALGAADQYEFLLHDRDSIFASHLDASIRKLGVRALKSPPRSPKVNAICERVIGTIRRECLDWLIPLSESHLRSILKSWVPRYNGGRPHMALGPGIPDAQAGSLILPNANPRHRRGE